MQCAPRYCALIQIPCLQKTLIIITCEMFDQRGSCRDIQVCEGSRFARGITLGEAVNQALSEWVKRVEQLTLEQKWSKT